jgi:hypothetical protein
VSKPDKHAGYYDSCSIETQSVTFPAELLLMSIDEIRVWKIEERKKYDAEQKAKREREAREQAEQRTILELQTLAALKAKYETPNV